MQIKTYKNGYLKMELNEDAATEDVVNFLNEVNGNKIVKIVVKAHKGDKVEEGFNRDNLSEFDYYAKKVWHQDTNREMKVTQARKVNLGKLVSELQGEVLVKIKLVNDYTAENFMIDNKEVR